ATGYRRRLLLAFSVHSLTFSKINWVLRCWLVETVHLLSLTHSPVKYHCAVWLNRRRIKGDRSI
ncbi:hypothetical protein PMAYCL1PPCAC_04406, partial [Pristionchus mayeri]